MSKQIQEAYIVAATRTPVGKAPRGMFRHTRPDDLLAHVLQRVLAQAPSLDPAAVGDVIVGCAMPEAEQGINVARIALLLAGIPNTVPGVTVNELMRGSASCMFWNHVSGSVWVRLTWTTSNCPSLL